MFFDGLAQFIRTRLFGHPRQSFDQLVFRIVQIAEVVDVEFAQRIDFHSIPPGKKNRHLG
jgi:hypothetical protein